MLQATMSQNTPKLTHKKFQCFQPSVLIYLSAFDIKNTELIQKTALFQIQTVCVEKKVI